MQALTHMTQNENNDRRKKNECLDGTSAHLDRVTGEYACQALAAGAVLLKPGRAHLPVVGWWESPCGGRGEPVRTKLAAENEAGDCS